MVSHTRTSGAISGVTRGCTRAPPVERISFSLNEIQFNLGPFSCYLGCGISYVSFKYDILVSISKAISGVTKGCTRAPPVVATNLIQFKTKLKSAQAFFK